jgi:SAM-dependent methyltransferase
MNQKEYWTHIWGNNDTKDLLWETNCPDIHLTTWLREQSTLPKHALEIGCGSGDNAIWMSQQGISVVAIDIAEPAIQLAKQKIKNYKVPVHAQVANILEDSESLGKFDFIFDRGCFHCMNIPSDQKRFAMAVNHILNPGGYWLSLIGSADGDWKANSRKFMDTAPRRTVFDIALAIESCLEFTTIQSTQLSKSDGIGYPAWMVVSKKRKTLLHD